MSLQIMRALPRVEALLHAPSFARHLERFRPEIRPAVIALARRHRRLAELSQSFPALLLALARSRAGFDPEPVIDAVVQGAPLAALAGAACVPMWLRRMPVPMLVAPLPLLPDSPFIRRRIVNHFPVHARYAAAWFAAVSQGYSLAHEGFALWCAQNYAGRTQRRGRRRRDVFRLLCLWSWYSLHPGTRGHALMQKIWTPEIQYNAAVDAAYDWQEMLDLEIHLGPHGIDDVWLQPGVADGYAFVPLRTVGELAEEAQAMRNCLRSYGEDVANGFSRVWSMRQGGMRVASLEIRRRGNDPQPYVAQLCLADNEEPPAALWLAAHRWMAAQPATRFDTPLTEWRNVRPDRAAWLELWKPYWLSRRCVPAWLPLVPQQRSLYNL